MYNRSTNLPNESDKKKGQEMEYTDLKFQNYLSRDSDLNLNEQGSIQNKMQNDKY